MNEKRPLPIRKKLISEPKQTVEEEKKHNRILLHALQTCHPVIYEGKQCFIHTFNVQVYGGGLKTTIYLTNGKGVPPADLTIDQNHQTIDAAQPATN